MQTRVSMHIMKQIVIPITVIILLVHSSTPLLAQEAKEPKSPIISAAGNKVDEIVGDEENEDDIPQSPTPTEVEESAAPSPTVAPSISPTDTPVILTPTPTPVIEITLPPISLPVIGGPEKENKQMEKRNDKKNEEREVEEEIEEMNPTPTVSPRSVEAPKSVQVKQRQQVERAEKEDEEDTSVIAEITKPIDPPLSLVRGSVKGSFYNTQGLSPQTSLYAILASLGFLSSGLLLMKNDLVKYFAKRGRVLPLPKSEPFTIPYIGSQYNR